MTNDNDVRKMPDNIPPFVKFCCANVPAVFDDSLSYYEALCALWKYLQDCIDVINNNALLEEEFIEKFNLLKDYVENYFDNLDVQAEINKKLDLMARDGTLTNLISGYIDPIFQEYQQDIDATVDTLRNEIESVVSGAPLSASSTAGMTDTSRIYVNTTDGKWYYYDGDSWEIGGTYQAAVDDDFETWGKLTINSASKNTRANYSPEFTDGYRIDSVGQPYADSGWSISNYLPYKDFFGLHIDVPATVTSSQVAFYDKDKTFISRTMLVTQFNVSRVIPENTEFFRYCAKTDEIEALEVYAYSDLDNRLDLMEAPTNIYLKCNTHNQSITTNVNIGATVDLTPTTNSNYRYMILDCKYGDVFRIGGYGGNNPRLWAFLDSDNKLLAKADYDEHMDEYITVAPKNAVKIVINLHVIAGNTYYIYNESSVCMATLRDSYDFGTTLGHNGKNIKTNYNVGETVSLTPENVSGWRYAIVDMPEDIKIYVKGTAGHNPRLWAFIDKDNKLISNSASMATDDTIITSPEGTAKAIFNFNNSYARGLKVFSHDSMDSLQKQVDDLSEDTDYPIVENSVARENCAFIRGLDIKHSLDNYLVDFKKPTDTMCHVGTFKIIDGMVYVTYYCSETATVEVPTEQIVRFVTAPLNNLSDKTYYDILEVGDTFDDKTVTAIYDTILVQVDSDTLYIMWTCALNGTYTRLYQPYTISTSTFGDVAYNYFKVNNTSLIMNTNNMMTLLDSAGITYPSISMDIGIMQKFSTYTEDNIQYYYTGCYAGRFNCIVRTTDFITFEYVAQPTFKNDGLYENSVYVKNDKAYYYLRQSNGNIYSLLSYYDLQTKKWHEPLQVQDAQSRADFFEYGGKLYLIHNKQSRYVMSILEIDPYYMDLSIVYDELPVDNYHYPYVDIYNNELYVIFTHYRSGMFFAKFNLGNNDQQIADWFYGKLNS